MTTATVSAAAAAAAVPTIDSPSLAEPVATTTHKRRGSSKTCKGYRKTEFTGVYWRNNQLYFSVHAADGRWGEARFGKGTPKDAFLARERRQQREDRIRSGLLDPQREAVDQQASRPLGSLVDEFQARLENKGDSPAHVRDTIVYVKRCIWDCEFSRIMDFDPSRVSRWLAELDLSARSRNAHRTAVLSFTRWATDYGRAPRNMLPAGLIQRYDEDADRRRLSRAMTQAQSAQLFAALLDPARMLGEFEKHDKLLAQARERRVFYMIAANTGLRWREIARLTWADVHLDDPDTGLVVVPAGRTKNKREARLPLVRPVVEALLSIRPLMLHASVQTAQQPIFSRQPRHTTWKRDLARAGIIKLAGPIGRYPTNSDLLGFVDDRGRRLDRKCLRLSFGTWLQQQGEKTPTARALMRHSDINLTLVTYNDLDMGDLRTAVNKMADSAKAKPPAPAPADAQADPAPAPAADAVPAAVAV